ncbi:unnamed protein product [marine sediment metagenome]|uniref:Uncharacterized protein n=1 Tax=marine sediment metagenome TaxID=412755 RepID=X1NP39_9ZZZZ
MKEIKDEHGRPYYIPTTPEELGCCIATHARRHRRRKPDPEGATIEKELSKAGLQRG